MHYMFSYSYDYTILYIYIYIYIYVCMYMFVYNSQNDSIHYQLNVYVKCIHVMYS